MPRQRSLIRIALNLLAMAVTLAPLIARFGWTADDLDKLAQGSLAGHLIEGAVTRYRFYRPPGK